jgi:hypothetical protein
MVENDLILKCSKCSVWGGLVASGLVGDVDVLLVPFFADAL